MRRPFSDYRVIGPVGTNILGFRSSGSGGVEDMLQPTTEVVDPRDISKQELKKAAKMFSLLHEQVAKTAFKNRWEIDSENERLPHIPRKIDKSRPLGSLIQGITSDANVPAASIEVTNVNVYGSGAESVLGLREPISVHRKASKISDEVFELKYSKNSWGSGYNPDKPEADYEDWDDLSIQRKKKILELYLKSVFKAIDEDLRQDRHKQTNKLWMNNLIYSDIDYTFGFEGISSPAREEFIDEILFHTNDGEDITNFSSVTKHLVGTSPHPQDSLVAGHDTRIPDDLPLTIRSDVNNVIPVGEVTNSDRREVMDVWDTLRDNWRTIFPHSLNPSLRLSDREIMNDIPTYADFSRSDIEDSVI